MRTIATIEARMTSSRLPGKVLLKVLDKPLLSYLIERLKSVPSLDGIILAVTTNSQDDILATFAASENIMCYRGSESDVMARVIGAGQAANADTIVEITGDCPLIDPQIIEQAIQIFYANNADYVSNSQKRSYPDGMDVQVFSLDTLEYSASLTSDILDHEHVTLHIRNNPEIFSHLHLIAAPNMYWPELGLTIDEQADYELIQKIIEHFGRGNLFGCVEIIDFLKKNNHMLRLNENVKRKGDS